MKERVHSKITLSFISSDWKEKDIALPLHVVVKVLLSLK